MKLGRILGVILSIVFIASMAKYSKLNEMNAMANSLAVLDNSGTVSESQVDFGYNELSEDKNYSVNVITFTNNFNYPVFLTSDNIEITCSGKNESDEALAKKGFKIKTLFADSLEGNRNKNINVPKKEKAYIFVTNEYTLDEYPQEQVDCNYKISIMTT